MISYLKYVCMYGLYIYDGHSIIERKLCDIDLPYLYSVKVTALVYNKHFPSVRQFPLCDVLKLCDHGNFKFL
jgi:hypothetical protein